MRNLAILGASGHGKVVADTAEHLGYNCVFYDDVWPKLQHNAHWDVNGSFKKLLENISEYYGVVVAIGNNQIRMQKLAILKKQNINLPVLIHPHAHISQYAQVECGSVVFAGAVVNAYASIGSGSILNTGCSIDHDCILGNGVHISPGARLAGGVTIGDCAWIGIGAVVRQNLSIGAQSVVGAGSVVVKDVAVGAIVAGNPARQM